MIPEGQTCQWQMFERQECPRLATERSGLHGLVNWVPAEHFALEIPSAANRKEVA